MQKHRDRHEYLMETPIPRLIGELSVPTVISMLVTGIYNSADTYFVGRISTEATAAVGLVFTVMAIIQALGFFCGHGSGNYLSRLLGAGKNQEANEIAATGFALALCIGVAIAALGNLLAPQLSVLIGATDTSRGDTVAYMRIILLGAPFMVGQFVINNQLRFQGSAFYAMVGLMCGAVINIALDPMLMFGFGLGVRGAAIATVSGQLVSFIALLVGSGRGENIRLRAKNVRMSAANLGQIINGGMPSLARQGLAAVSTLLMAAAATVCLIWAKPIVGWFRDDPEVVAVGAEALRWQASALPLLATSVLTNMMLQATGQGVKASITSSARNGIFFIPLILTLPRAFGLAGVEMTQAWADVLTFLLCLYVMRGEWRELNEKMTGEA